MNIKSFVKQVATIAIGFFISLIALCSLVVFGFLTFTANHPKKAGDNSVLTLNMGGQIVEQMPTSSLFGSNKGMIDFKAVQNAIYQATKDSCISAIYLDLSNLTAGWAVLGEIREKLLAFKKEGKTIIAYGDSYTQQSYYLASVADEIILNPSGLLEFKGLAAAVYFYTKLLEHIGVKPIIFRTGPYKDYAESFCLTKMSEESRAQTKTWLNSINEYFLTKISASRSVAVPTLKAHANNLSAVLPNDALHANLITKIGYETDAKKLLKEKLKSSSFISYRHYTIPAPSSEGDKVAVLIAEGMIIPGPSWAGCIGAHDFVKRVKVIQEDSSIKAVVLRINSPGGDILASDLMWKAIEELKCVKPVVASMSNVAASGGYYIAAPCNYIFAQPTTITGSIGTLGIFPDPSALMDKIGIHYDAVKTAPSADFLSPRVSCSELEAKFIHKKLQSSYDDFLRKVSNGRKMDVASVEKLAGGRVYTGLAALNNGLVDELGGLDAAIAKAASLANLTEKYGVCYFPRPKTRLQQLLNYTTYNMKMEALHSLVQAYPILNYYQILSRSNGVQAILPYTIDIN